MTDPSEGVGAEPGTVQHVEATNRLIEALVDAEKRMRRRIELLSDAVFETDDTGTVTFLSSAWSQITGVGVESTTGRQLVELVVEDDRDVIASALRPTRNGFRVRARFQRPDGRVVPTLVVTAPIESGGVVGVVQDITQVLASQEELSMLSIVASSTDNYVVITDAAGNTEWVNPAFERKTGYTLSEIIGRKPGHVLQGPATDKATVGRIREGIAAGRSVREELVNYSKDGASYWVQLQITPVRNGDGELERFVSVQIDVTDSKVHEQQMQQQRSALETAVVKRTAQLAKAKDEAEAAARAKGSFVANMSHEMRTPLNAITGLTRLLGGTELDTVQSDYVHKIASAAGVLMHTVSDVLDFSRVEADAVTLEATPFRLSSMLRSVEAVVGILATEKALDFRVHLDPDLPEKVVGDRFRLEQVLINLAGNAVKFTGRGSVTVALRGEPAPAGVAVRFEVADTGVGIAPGDVQRLFEPFTQADSSTTRVYGGTGLGLSIVQRLVGLMGGTVGVDSEPGRGSTFGFTVVLGAVSGDQTSGDQTGAIPRSTGTKLLGVRVLVAEDNEFNQQVVAELLESEGALVTVVSSGPEVLERVAGGAAFDVVLMDVQMPGMDGLECTRRLRGLSAGADLLVIAMTANAFDAHRVACLAAGMDDFETKPVDLERLCRTIARWLPDLVEADDVEPPRPAVDPSVLATLLNNDEVKVRRFGLRFVETTRSALDEMRAALAAGDIATVHRLAHGVRPAAASVGAEPLSRMAGELEAASSSGHVPDAETRIGAMVRELDRVAEVLAR